MTEISCANWYLQELTRAILLFCVGVVATLGAGPGILRGVAAEDGNATQSAGSVTTGEQLFVLSVQPLLAEKCMACHGDDPEELGGSLDLRSRDYMLVGGDSFGDRVLVPGSSESSWLYRVTIGEEEDFEMPPKASERLTEEQAWSIRDWIDAGAPWPDSNRTKLIQQQFAQGVVVKTSGGLNNEWTHRRYDEKQLWAYRPLAVEPIGNGEHPVDWFVDRKLTALGLKAAPSANPRELVRRMSFGLTGLPPDTEAVQEFVEEFVQDPATAVSKYARELMASPHYGEHFGRMWLDVVRYADSAGLANDFARPNAWRYRDYVVRAFNQDLPYDQFILQQLAGDELDSDDPNCLIATGFLRMGPWEQTSMSVFRETRQQWLDDITDSVGQTFLAHPLQCAKCHDHKFDPVPTRDYYAMLAVFSTTQFAERDAAFLESENQLGFAEADQWTQAKIAAYEQQRKELKASIQRRQRSETHEAKVGDNGLDPGDEASVGRMTKNIARHRWELDKTQPIALAAYTGKTIERSSVASRLSLPDDPWDKGTLEHDTILNGGDTFSRGELVQPGPLSAAISLGHMDAPDIKGGLEKRRLSLARWIADRKNPLTARVIVNRIWSWHFGKGLAGNPNNFGATGALPTHPELLDYLADWFMAHDWSVKSLNELIVTSSTYRRSSRHPDPRELDQRDANREFYAAFVPRRLTAEELRDAMLSASGELNRQVGGIPCRPDINLEVAMQPRQIMGGVASVYEPDPLPSQRNRRSLYAEKIRGLRDPFLESFNQPSPDKACEMRETSTVAPQALTLVNSVETRDRALAFAVRLLSEKGSDAQIVSRAFEIALSRAATPTEVEICLLHWTSATHCEESLNHSPEKLPAEITRTIMAEKTGEPYDFVEIMPAYKNYVPDLQPAEADARTRGLSQLCLVLFNLNEFIYLD
ncbi:MAG: PSD1 and planctomycete cytochrome C domain-containing protein [Pirellulaceae bacterium]